MKKLRLLLLFLTVSVVAQDNLKEGPFPQLIIRGVTLINGNGSPPCGPIDIVVENNKIVTVQVVGYPGVEIDDSKRPQLKPGGKELDCSGMYLLPGFIDMHGHIGGVAQGADYDYVFKLWMAHGITTIREPAGRGVDWAMELKQRSAKNEIIAPRVFVYTRFGQGNDQPISTPEMAREWVRENAKKGADGVKFFGAPPEIMGAALDENKKLGLRSACHHAQMDVAMWNVLQSARAGLTTMEHWYGLPEALFQDRTVRTIHWITIIKMNNIVLKRPANYGNRLHRLIQNIGTRLWMS